MSIFARADIVEAGTLAFCSTASSDSGSKQPETYDKIA